MTFLFAFFPSLPLPPPSLPPSPSPSPSLPPSLPSLPPSPSTHSERGKSWSIKTPFISHLTSLSVEWSLLVKQVIVILTPLMIYPMLPGVLVAKKAIFKSSQIPHICGGGTVFFVTPSTHRYFKEAEMREEGGTPSIVGAVRAGLAMQLKEAVSSESIMSLEEDLCRHVFSEWEGVEELVVVGPHHVPRLPIFSFLVRHPPSRLFLHHNFVCALLNDLFGIQARGGCSCAGPYAQVRWRDCDLFVKCLLWSCVPGRTCWGLVRKWRGSTKPL